MEEIRERKRMEESERNREIIYKKKKKRNFTWR